MVAGENDVGQAGAEFIVQVAGDALALGLERELRGGAGEPALTARVLTTPLPPLTPAAR